MQAIDIMTPKVVSVGPDAEVREIAQLLLKHRISAVPVVDSERRVIGIVTATLDQVNVLRESGFIPQNVNFAVKIDYVKPTFDLAIGYGVHTTKQKGEPSAFSKLVADIEPSVVLIIAK